MQEKILGESSTHGEYDTVLPAKIRFSPCISPMAKVLYSEILHGAGEPGAPFSFDVNVIADWFQYSKGAILKSLQLLEDAGYVQAEVIYEFRPLRRVKERRVYPMIWPQGGG